MVSCSRSRRSSGPLPQRAGAAPPLARRLAPEPGRLRASTILSMAPGGVLAGLSELVGLPLKPVTEPLPENDRSDGRNEPDPC